MGRNQLRPDAVKAMFHAARYPCLIIIIIIISTFINSARVTQCHNGAEVTPPYTTFFLSQDQNMLPSHLDPMKHTPGCQLALNATVPLFTMPSVITTKNPQSILTTCNNLLSSVLVVRLFLPRDAMHKRGLCMPSCGVCLSVRHVRGSCQNE